jgi:hypothetical protein
MQDKATSRVVLGCLETIDLPDYGICDVVAKVDTGALTGALHCEDIKIEKENGVSTLYFRPLDASHDLQSTTDFIIRRVVSASGHIQKRCIIPIKLKLRGVLYDTYIGITNRDNLGRPMLLGRGFIGNNNMLVDVRVNQEKDDEREMIL